MTRAFRFLSASQDSAFPAPVISIVCEQKEKKADRIWVTSGNSFFLFALTEN